MTEHSDNLPAPDDLAGWKAVERALGERLSERICSINLDKTALLRQYFGTKRASELVERYADVSVMHAFIEWLVHDHRPVFRLKPKGRNKKGRRKQSKRTRLGKTLAEKLLNDGLPAAEETALRASCRAHPSLWRITQVDQGTSVDAEDVLLGGQCRIHDVSLSECVEVGFCLAGRVFEAGQFHFFCPAGPVLPAPLVRDAADHLESLGVEFTREGLIRGAGEFGRLWKWYDRRLEEGFAPELRNTDGDELLFQTASFAISDEEAVRRVLDEREDIDYDEQNGQYIWLREQEDNAVVPGEVLSLGRLELLDDELVLQVNSAQRLRAARRWIEAIPNVECLGVTTRQLEASDIPMDDRMGPQEPAEVTPDMAFQLEQYLHRHYISWLDRPLQALDGKTPREACDTQAGRRKVAMLIRTIPAPEGNAGVQVEVPRREMFRQLGLEPE